MLTDEEIRERIADGGLAIENIGSLDEQLSSVGVDLRVGPDYKRSSDEAVIDARSDPSTTLHFEPGVFYNVRTRERLRLPNDVVGLVDSRSTIERSGLSVRGGGTVDPGFDGVLEFGVYNCTEETISVELGYPIVQVSFIELSDAVGVPYGDREGALYQGQESVAGSKELS